MALNLFLEKTASYWAIHIWIRLSNITLRSQIKVVGRSFSYIQHLYNRNK